MSGIGWSKKRSNAEIRASHYEDGRSKSHVGYVNPMDFLHATTSNDDELRTIVKSAGNLNREKIEEETQSPFLIINNGKISGHEGRHRMAALAKAGYTSAPVAIHYRGNYGEFRHPIDSATFGPQYNDKRNPVTVSNMIPLHYDYKNQIDDMMEQHPEHFEDGGGITAYHGSPHEFDQFDSSKIGTGEGAQARGHGMYFAESEPVAKSYRDRIALNRNQMSLVDATTGEPLSEDTPGHKFLKSFFDSHAYDMRQGDRENQLANWDRQKEYLQKSMKEFEDSRSHPDLQDAASAKWIDDEIADRQSDIEGIDAAQKILHKVKAKPIGHMYEVHIDAHPDHFLDWDKPISQQSEHVGNAIKSLMHLTSHERDNMPINSFYEMLGSPKEASERLHGAGVHGIKYLDAGSRGVGKGTRNYVVFDDKRVNVKRKYAEGGEVEGYSKGGSPDLDIVREHLKRTASPLSDDPAKVHKALSIAESLKVPQGNKAGVGSFYNLVSPHAVKDVTSTVEDIPGVTHLEPRQMSWDDLYKEGKGGSFINVAGDRTNLGRLTHINGKELSWPVDMHAGPKYMLEPNRGEVWANNQTHATGFKNVIAKAAKKGPVYGIYSPMGAQAGDFSYHMFDALMAQIPSSGLTKEGADYFNDLVKKGLHRPADKRKDAIKLMEKWPGIENPKEASEFAKNLPGSHRSDMIKKLDGKVMKDFGMPDVGVTRVAITDPALRDLPGNMLGHRVVRFDPDKLIEGEKSLNHTSYPIASGGEYVGDIPPVQRHYAAPDVTDEKIAKLVGQNQDLVVHPYSLDPLGRGTYRKAFEEQKQIQPINQRMLESVQQGLENQKLYGFANGGSADIDHALKLARRAGGSVKDRPHFGFGGEGEGPISGSTGSAAGNSYGGGYSANGGEDSPSESARSVSGNGNDGGGSNAQFSGNGRDSGVGNIGLGSMVAFGHPTMSSTFGKSDPGNDAQLSQAYAGASAPFLAGMAGSQLAKDYVASATGNSPLADPFVNTSNPERNRIIAPEESPTIKVPSNLTNRQIVAMMQPQPTTATTATTPVQAAAEAAPSLSDIMGTTPQGNYLFSGMNLGEKTVPNTYTVDPNSIVQQVRTENPGYTGFMYGENNPQNNAKLQADIIGGLGGYGLNFKGNTLTGDINEQSVQDALKTAGVAQSSFKPVTETTATTNWGAPANMASYPVGNVAPQGFADVYNVSPSQQYEQPSRPMSQTPSTAYAQPQQQQTVRQNFEQSFANARNSGAETFYWTNPATGRTELYTTQLARAAGGRAPDDRESMIRHALSVAFRYGS